MKKLILIFVLIFIIFAGVASAYYFYNLNLPANNRVACTMEAKLCPDGSYVGRTGPNCEFTACPEVKTSGINGTVLLGPMCPVERIPPDPKCDDRPYKTDLVAKSPDGTQIFQQFSSDENGKFSIILSPGEYIISSAENANIFSHCTSNRTIKVVANQYVLADISCDTGIR